MSRRTGSFEEFKEYTLAVARRERKVDPREPKMWREPKAKSLEGYSIGDLEKTKQRITETEEWVSQKAKQLPGAGWDHVSAMLREDREAVEAEINRRLPE